MEDSDLNRGMTDVRSSEFRPKSRPKGKLKKYVKEICIIFGTEM